jgi:type IV pilus assembly protein PilM
MARTSIGLDIGTRAVRLAEIQMSGGRPMLTRFGRMLLPIGAVDHGEIQDPQAVSVAITTLWKRLGLSGRAVHVGVANRRVVVRVIEMPAMSHEDLAGAIRYQAQEHIPIPLEQAVMDFEVLDEIESPDGERAQRVLVVAAERATIEPLLASIREAKLELASLELNAYPLVRCFGGPEIGTEAIVDIGAGVTNVVIHSEGKIRFTRILPTFGGEEFTMAVATGLGVERDEAETLKRRASVLLSERALEPVSAQVGGGTAYASEPSFQAEPSAETAADDPFGGSRTESSVPMMGSMNDPSPLAQAAAIIEPLLDRFTTEVRGSIDFYASQAGAKPVERVVLTGGGALLGGLTERLASSLQIPVEQGHPFERVPIGQVQVSSEERAVAEPFLGVAVGLALAGVK